MTLQEAHYLIGRKIVHIDQFLPNKQYGIITSVNDVYIFVKYNDSLPPRAMNPHNVHLDEK